MRIPQQEESRKYHEYPGPHFKSFVIRCLELICDFTRRQHGFVLLGCIFEVVVADFFQALEHGSQVGLGRYV